MNSFFEAILFPLQIAPEIIGGIWFAYAAVLTQV